MIENFGSLMAGREDLQTEVSKKNEKMNEEAQAGPEKRCADLTRMQKPVWAIE